MAAFLENLFNSIFTPGPTPTLLVATNASFACLQLLFLALLIATYSIHFLILSVLSGGLWWAINWFVAELLAATAKEEEAKRLRGLKREKDLQGTSGDDTETEVEKVDRGQEKRSTPVERLGQDQDQDQESSLRKRLSVGDRSGEISTDSEWEQVDEEGIKDR